MSAASTREHAAPPVAPRPGRRGWLRLILWIVIFGSGFVAGTGVTLIAVRQGMLQAIHHPREMPANLANRLRRPLSLNDRQVAQIREILGQRQRALEIIRGRVQPEVMQELDLLDSQISEVLDAEQRSRWNALFDRMRATWIPSLPARPPADPAPD